MPPSFARRCIRKEQIINQKFHTSNVTFVLLPRGVLVLQRNLALTVIQKVSRLCCILSLQKYCCCSSPNAQSQRLPRIVLTTLIKSTLRLGVSYPFIEYSPFVCVHQTEHHLAGRHYRAKYGVIKIVLYRPFPPFGGAPPPPSSSRCSTHNKSAQSYE